MGPPLHPVVMTATTPKATNIVWHEASVDRQARASQRGHSSSILWFTGLSGSGKSTTAEALGKIDAGMGIVRHPEIREVRRSDFCGHYIGESGPKTEELIEKALGRIIFMDEFY